MGERVWSITYTMAIGPWQASYAPPLRNKAKLYSGIEALALNIKPLVFIKRYIFIFINFKFQANSIVKGKSWFRHPHITHIH